jgi:hypothetical protein
MHYFSTLFGKELGLPLVYQKHNLLSQPVRFTKTLLSLTGFGMCSETAVVGMLWYTVRGGNTLRSGLYCSSFSFDRRLVSGAIV